MSRIFKCILYKVCKGEVKEPFRASDVIECLGNSTPFLSKHAIDPLNKNKNIMGNPYFIRVGRGLYKINPEFKNCP